MGGQDCFGEDAPLDMRWRIMLESGSREGEELRRVWSKLRQEELQAAAWLEKAGGRLVWRGGPGNSFAG